MAIECSAPSCQEAATKKLTLGTSLPEWYACDEHEQIVSDDIREHTFRDFRCKPEITIVPYP